LNPFVMFFIFETISFFDNFKKSSMKNLSVFIILMIPFLSICQHDFKKLINVSDLKKIPSDEVLFAGGTLDLVSNFDKKGRSFKYIISPIKADKHNTGMISHLLWTLNANKFKVDWQVLDGMVQEFLNDNNIDPFVFSDKHKSGLQFAAYQTAHRNGLSAPQTPERDSMLVKYMHILMAQKGQDCQDSAELLKAVEKSLKPSVLKKYRDELLEISKIERTQADQEINEMKENFHAQSEDNLKLKMKREIDRYLGAEEAIKLLNESGN